MNKRQRDRLIYSGLMIVCIVGFWLFENFYTPAEYSSSSDDLMKSKIPEFMVPSSSDGEVIEHDHYTLSYLEDFEQAEWVLYTLKKDQLTRDLRERPEFLEDPYVRTKSADWRNYRGSGYNRGHLCPAGDRRFNELAYRETFYTSNIVPQHPDFNAGIWNDLEKQVRIWCKSYGSLGIVTGGVLEPGLRRIGEEGVAVPRWFYKIVMRGTAHELEVLGFLFPHDPDTGSLEQYLVSIDEIEAKTGIDFLKQLPDDVEDKLESAVSSVSWRFTAIH